MQSWRSRRARRQVSESDLPSGVPPQNGLTFNVWYNKWSQGGSGHGRERFVSPFRLDTRRDPGTTLAGSDARFCLYFARGCCVMGPKCTYLHHIPDESDAANALFSGSSDCFGRQKFAELREDMGGVGSFNSHNATLYVGGISGALNGRALKPAQIESRLRFMFTRLGSIERIRYVEDKNCAFVKYRRQLSAEFAREVMMNQTLLLPNDREWDQRLEGAGLLVKWARDDPNPEAQQQQRQNDKKHVLHLLKTIVAGAEEKETDPSKTEEVPEPNDKLSPFLQQAKKRLHDRGIELEPALKRLKEGTSEIKPR